MWRNRQSPDSAMVLEIAASTVKNSHFSLFPRNDVRIEFCGDPSGSVPFNLTHQWSHHYVHRRQSCPRRLGLGRNL